MIPEPATGQFPPELGGTRDFDCITPRGRRLTEYEAVTCYTQPQTHGGGLQPAGEYQLCPDGRPIFDPESTSLNATDWFAFRDPNQMWQRPYYVTQSQAERSIERATDVALNSGSLAALEPDWAQLGLVGAFLPFGHFEYGLFRALNRAARDALSDSISYVLAFNAADKLRHAQAISLFGLDAESALEDLDARTGKSVWLEDPAWQPLRRLVEEVMATVDWCEITLATNLVIEPVIGEPFRRLVLGLTASRNRDLIVPVIAGTGSADWHRNAKAAKELLTFLLNCAGGEDNAAVIMGWLRDWQARAVPVAEDLFGHLETKLGEAGLKAAAKSTAEEELRRAGADQLDAFLSAV